MKRLSVLTAGVFFMAGALLSAQSFDINLDGSASVSRTSDTSASFSQGVNFGFTLPLGTAHRLAAKLGTSVGVSYSAGEAYFTYPAALGDIDLQELSYSFNGPVEKEGFSSLAFNVGRIPFADSTGAIYVYRVDGAQVQAVYGAFQVGATVGYTGFLPGSAPILAGASDTLYGNNSFAPARSLLGFSVKTSIVPRHQIYVAFLAMEDQRESADENLTTVIPEWQSNLETSGQGISSDAAYIDAGFSGAFGALSYSGYTAIQLGHRLKYVEDANSSSGYFYKYVPIRAFSLALSARYPLSASINLSGRFSFGSGDPDGGETALEYQPITRASSGMVFSPQPGNVSLLEAVVAYKPFPKVSIGLESVQGTSKTVLFFKNGVGSVSEAGIDPDAAFSLLGIEEDISATVRLMSDFNVNMALGAFIPITGAFFPSYTATSPFQFMLRAGFSIAL